jgi:adenylate cyclase
MGDEHNAAREAGSRSKTGEAGSRSKTGEAGSRSKTGEAGSRSKTGEAGSARPAEWVGRLARLFERGDEPEEQVESDAQYQRFEELILGGTRRYTRGQLVGEYGLDIEQVSALWRSLGFAEVGDAEVVFTEQDRDALRQLERLRSAGLLPGEVEDAMARAVGQAMAGLADWQVELLYQLVDYGHRGVSQRELREIAERVIPLLERMQGYIWRRHVAAAASRLLTSMSGNGGAEANTRTLAVGFADLVGFTRASRRLSPAELTELLEEFQGIAADLVARYQGRVVKTVGDEVMFVAEQPGEAVEIALGFVDRLADAESLPQLRIGLALGDVVTRFGDVYGEAVNIAARLTAQARPGRVLVDRNLATALADDPRFQLRSRRPVHVRGYRHLQQWELRRAQDEQRDTEPAAHPTADQADD